MPIGIRIYRKAQGPDGSFGENDVVQISCGLISAGCILKINFADVLTAKRCNRIKRNANVDPRTARQSSTGQVAVEIHRSEVAASIPEYDMEMLPSGRAAVNPELKPII